MRHDPRAYYHRPFVQEIVQIFGDPTPPAKITEKQFDYWQKGLEDLVAKKWHEIESLSYYLMDLKYVDPLQADLFDYLFPVCLITWRDGIEQRKNLPHGECDFYSAVDRGNIYHRMLSPKMRKQVFDWMVRVFMWGVSTIRSEECEAIGLRNDNLHYFHWTFNAIGESTPITGDILRELSRVTNPGIARYWLTFASGLCWDEQKVPWISPWTPDLGGGGVYLLESNAEIFEHGFLESNLAAYSEFLTRERIKTLLEQADEQDILQEEHERVRLCLTRMHSMKDAFDARLKWFIAGLPLGSLDRTLYQM